MKPMTLGIATGLFMLTCFAPVIPGGAISNGNPSRVYSLTDAFFISNAMQAIGDNMLVNAAQAAENVMDVTNSDKPSIDVSKLLKIDGEDYSITADSSVSMEPISNASVRKIGYGHEVLVSVVTTSTGTYSTDGFVSPHVLYPGITVEHVNAAEALKQRLSGVLTLGQFKHWFSTTLDGAGSFVTLGTMQGGGRFVAGEDRTCLDAESFAGCN